MLIRKLTTNFLSIQRLYFTQQIHHRGRSGAEGVVRLIHNMPRNVIQSDLKNTRWITLLLIQIIVLSLMINQVLPQETHIGCFSMTWTRKRGRFLGFSKINYQFTDWLSGFIRVGADVTNVDTYGLDNQVTTITQLEDFRDLETEVVS